MDVLSNALMSFELMGAPIQRAQAQGPAIVYLPLGLIRRIAPAAIVGTGDSRDLALVGEHLPAEECIGHASNLDDRRGVAPDLVQYYGAVLGDSI